MCLRNLLTYSLLAYLCPFSQATAEQIQIGFSKVTLINYRTEQELPWNKTPKPNRPMLRIDFSSNVNLSKIASSSGLNLAARTYFCDDPWFKAGKLRAVGLTSVFWQGNRLAPGNEGVGSAAPPHNYYTYIFVEGRLSYDGREEVKEFYDLRQSIRDICLQVRGANVTSVSDSNTVVIPKETIARALGVRVQTR